MIFAGAAALLLLAFAGSQHPPRAQSPQATGVTVRHQLIIRVPRGARPTAPAGASPIHWREGRGPRCVSTREIVGATLLGQDSVDLILRDSSRIRAHLQRRCPALDYYYGFYVSPTPDGMICADRDSIRSRVGGECQIDQFRSLRPAAR